jgi:hypothetical protein
MFKLLNLAGIIPIRLIPNKPHHNPDQLTFVLETGSHCSKKGRCRMSFVTGCI